jgi:hypothetical protein
MITTTKGGRFSCRALAHQDRKKNVKHNDILEQKVASGEVSPVVWAKLLPGWPQW